MLRRSSIHRQFSGNSGILESFSLSDEDLDLLSAAGFIASRFGLIAQAECIWRGISPFCRTPLYPIMGTALAYLMGKKPKKAVELLEGAVGETKQEQQDLDALLGSALILSGCVSQGSLLLAPIAEQSESSSSKDLARWLLYGEHEPIKPADVGVSPDAEDRLVSKAVEASAE